MLLETSYFSSSDWLTLDFLLTHVTTVLYNSPRKCTPVKRRGKKLGFQLSHGQPSIDHTNQHILPTEIFKEQNRLNSVIIEENFKFKNLTYDFRNAETFSVEYYCLLEPHLGITKF